MSNDVTKLDNGNDGWEDAAADFNNDVVRGDLIKCSDGHWTVGRDNAPIREGTCLVAIGTAASWVKWRDNKPVEYRIRQRGEPMPDRKDLGDTDENDWESGPDGKPRDPWQNTRFCYFTDPKSAALFTYSTATWSGRSAVIGLGDQIMRMRTARPGATAHVEFQTRPSQTKYGRKMVPVLKIVGWTFPVGDGAPGQGSGGSMKVIEQKPVKEAVTDDMLDDAIPF
jgi:hypothetical protein